MPPLRFSDKEVDLIRDNALPEPARSPFSVSRPSQLLAKTPKFSVEPLIYCANGQTLSQRLTRGVRKTPQTLRQQQDGATDTPHVSEYFPSQSPSKAHRAGPALGEKQWKRWTYDVIPKLVPVFLRLWYETESLRNSVGLELPTLRACGCKARMLEVAVVRMNFIENVRVRACACQTAPQQLLAAGLFPCSPQRPSLAVDVGVLEFVRLLFVNLPPNNTAFCNTLEGFLASRGYKLTTKDTLRVRFANALQWYTTLRNSVAADIDKLLNAARHIFRGDEPQPSTPSSPRPPLSATAGSASSSTSTPSRAGSATPASPAPTPHAESSTSAPTATPTPRPRKRRKPDTSEEDSGDENAPNPFPDPPPRTRPSDYLISRCPACFGGLEHDPSQQVDVEVCLDACFTQKRRHKKGGRDPARVHPHTHFVPEDTAQKMDKHVEHVRPAPSKSKQARVEEEADGYEGAMKVPRSVLNECQSSFKAADEKRESSSTHFFADTGLMALLCRHDRVLWLVNMRTPGEKQYYALALLETLFQHLPVTILVGALYDIACQLHRSCIKFGFLGRYLNRILFAVSVFHAFAHRWACQLIYHPLKCSGFGFTNGEGCEHFWHSIAKLIPYLRVAGYHHRLHTLDGHIEHVDKASLGRLAAWLVRRKVHCDGKLQEAREELEACGVAEAILREEWKKQVTAQTKPAQRRSKTRGTTAIEEIILTRKRVDALFQKLTVLQDALVDPKSTAHVLLYAEGRVDGARAAWQKEQQTLQRLQAELGVTDATALQKLRHSDYYVARMNAKILKERLLARLRERKFELDVIERSFRRTRSENQRNEHAGAAIKRREPTIASNVKQYNKLCADIAILIKAKKAPQGAIAPTPIPARGLYQLDVDDAIWQDIGLDDDAAPALWLVDNKVRAGIRAMLQKDRCAEEAPRLLRERRHLRVWFATEWKAVSEAMELSEGALLYQFELRRRELLELCVLWKKSLDSLPGGEDLPPWGPTDEEILDCQITGSTASYGDGVDSEAGGDSDDEAGVEDESEESEDDLIYVLETVERADSYRVSSEVEDVQWASDDDDDDVFT